MDKSNEEISSSKKWKILICVVTMTFMTCIDGSIVNVALPMISHDLNVSMAGVQWIVTSYLMTISVLILLCGRLGDVKGKCKIFKIGILIFTIGSLMGGLSKSLPLLIVARVIQGTGAACTMANSMGIITSTFIKEGRGKAMGIAASAVALGTMIGPALGGIIVSFRWDCIFYINIPIGIINFIASKFVLNEIHSDTKEKIDIRGTLVFAIFIVSIILSVTEGEFKGYTSLPILIGFLISIISFSLFIYLQKTVKSPVLNLKLFKTKLFSLSVLCGCISFIGISCVSILLPFYLQDVLKMSPFEAGMFLMIYPIALAIVSPFSGSLSDKLNAELISLIGIILLTLGLFLMGTVKEGTNIWLLGIYSVVMGVGNGIFKSPNNSLVMADIKKNELGIAGSVNSLLRNIGMVFGYTLATTLLYDKMSSKIGYQVANYVPGRNDVFIYGMDCVFIVAGIICSIATIVAVLRYIEFKKVI